MSFILDALKKSEIERQRQSVPGLMDAGPPPRRARLPTWAIALAVLLAVNLTVLTVVLTRGALSGQHAPGSPAAAPPVLPALPASPAPPVAVAAAPPPSQPGASSVASAAPGSAASPAQHPFSPMDAAPPVYAPEVPPTDAPMPAPPPRAAREPVQRSAATDTSPRGRERDPLLTRTEPADTELLPTVNELHLTGEDALPELHLDVHVYATQPAERFVYINMRKYHEGNTLAEGPVLERIRRDGVVLDYRGVRFLLPRQG